MLLALSNLALSQVFVPREVQEQCEEIGLFSPQTDLKIADLANCKKSEDSIECPDGKFEKSDNFIKKVGSFFKNEKKELKKKQERTQQCKALGFVVENELASCIKENSLEIQCPFGNFKLSKNVAESERGNEKEDVVEKKEIEKAKKSSKQ